MIWHDIMPCPVPYVPAPQYNSAPLARSSKPEARSAWGAAGVQQKPPLPAACPPLFDSLVSSPQKPRPSFVIVILKKLYLTASRSPLLVKFTPIFGW